MMEQKLIFTQKRFCFNERFKTNHFNTYFYQHLFSSLIMSQYFQTKY